MTVVSKGKRLADDDLLHALTHMTDAVVRLPGIVSLIHFNDQHARGFFHIKMTVAIEGEIAVYPGMAKRHIMIVAKHIIQVFLKLFHLVPIKMGPHGIITGGVAVSNIDSMVMAGSQSPDRKGGQ